MAMLFVISYGAVPSAAEEASAKLSGTLVAYVMSTLAMTQTATSQVAQILDRGLVRRVCGHAREYVLFLIGRMLLRLLARRAHDVYAWCNDVGGAADM